jgi:hypothetical protein
MVVTVMTVVTVVTAVTVVTVVSGDSDVSGDWTPYRYCAFEFFWEAVVALILIQKILFSPQFVTHDDNFEIQS